ncbi:uncharacterized protein LTR77_003048 [Saxophila tyrrhenica]|uniref:Zinc-binding loop region of homing endonuclease domain-containing protein n=1 Tax=Saxophila tyrrhenica TaxID=1690608 RepID=A0AAV9PGB6_9PEZI|nr:hypothetical protein LTR77_003048 [Saxophila tyrrhenica]
MAIRKQSLLDYPVLRDMVSKGTITPAYLEWLKIGAAFETAKRRHTRSSYNPTQPTRECKARVFANPMFQRRCRKLTWEFLFLLGYDLPTVDEIGDQGWPQDELDKIWDELGCFANFWDTSTGTFCKLVTMENMYDHKDYVVNTRPVSRHQASCGTSFLIESGLCGQSKDDKQHVYSVIVFWREVIWVGSGYATPENLAKFAVKGSTWSHLCGNAYCVNPRGFVHESQGGNNGRNSCLEYGAKNCKHSPCCNLAANEKGRRITSWIRRRTVVPGSSMRSRRTLSRSGVAVRAAMRSRALAWLSSSMSGLILTSAWV